MLQYSPNNTQEMKQICGYEQVALIMRKKHWVLDEAMLSVLFNFVGLKKASRSSTYTAGVISNS
jgi:hypothetical protein